MSLPGKGLEGYICPTIVTSWWRHLERHELVGANKITLWSGGHQLIEVWRIMRRISYHDK